MADEDRYEHTPLIAFERQRSQRQAELSTAGPSHVGCCGTIKRGEGCTSCAPENAAETRSVMHQVRQPQG